MSLVTSPQNATVKAARKLARRRGRLRADGAFLVEGPEVVSSAANRLGRVFLAEDADAASTRAAARAEAAGAPVTRVTGEVLATLSDAVAPRGVVGVAHMRHTSLGEALDGAALAVLCCDVADPGNLGTIVRSADAAGADAVLVSAGAVDPTNPKAVRATAGSLFHLPVVDGVDPLEAIGTAARAGLRPVAADARGTSRHADADLARPTLLVLGGEAHGLAGDVRDACALSVAIPMHATPRVGYEGVAESLNLSASAAVLLFEAARQREAAGAPARGQRGAA